MLSFIQCNDTNPSIHHSQRQGSASCGHQSDGCQERCTVLHHPSSQATVRSNEVHKNRNRTHCLPTMDGHCGTLSQIEITPPFLVIVPRELGPIQLSRKCRPMIQEFSIHWKESPGTLWMMDHISNCVMRQPVPSFHSLEPQAAHSKRLAYRMPDIFLCPHDLLHRFLPAHS